MLRVGGPLSALEEASRTPTMTQITRFQEAWPKCTATPFCAEGAAGQAVDERPSPSPSDLDSGFLKSERVQRGFRQKKE